MELSFCRWRVVGWESIHWCDRAGEWQGPWATPSGSLWGPSEEEERPKDVRSADNDCSCHLLLFFFLSFLFWKQKPSAFNLLSFFFFYFNFCIGSCEIFVWKYINHISTVKETINKHPWIHHPDQEMKHCQHLRSPPCAGPWSQLYRDIIHCGFLLRSITIFPMVVNKYLGEVSWKLLSRCLLFLMRKPLTRFTPFFT